MTHKMISYKTWVSKLLPYTLYYVDRGHIYKLCVCVCVLVCIYIYDGVVISP